MRNIHSRSKVHIINVFLCQLELRAAFREQSFPWRSGLSVKHVSVLGQTKGLPILLLCLWQLFAVDA